MAIEAAEQPDSKFVEVQCSCKNEQIVFSKPADDIECLVCGEALAESTGGIAEFKGKIRAILD